jgi:hypothetical protein
MPDASDPADIVPSPVTAALSIDSPGVTSAGAVSPSIPEGSTHEQDQQPEPDVNPSRRNLTPPRDDPRLNTSPAGATAPHGGPTTPAPTGPDTRSTATTPGRSTRRRTVPLARPSTTAPVTAPVAEPVELTPVQTVMRARIAAIAAPRDSDDPQSAALRAVLRDERLMAHVIANVDNMPPLTDEQLDTIAALLNRSRRRT